MRISSQRMGDHEVLPFVTILTNGRNNRLKTEMNSQWCDSDPTPRQDWQRLMEQIRSIEYSTDQKSVTIYSKASHVFSFCQVLN